MNQRIRQDGKPSVASASAIAAALVMTIFMSTAGAAERIRWEDLQRRFGGDPACKEPTPVSCKEGLMHFHRITVITRVGKKYHTRRLHIHTDGLKMEGSKKQWIALPRNEVTRIEMRPWWRHVEDLAWPAMAPLVPAAMICGGISWEPTRLDPLCMALAVPVFLPGYAYLAVIAPFYVGADLVGFLRPATVFDILDGTPALGNSERESRGE